MSKKFLDITGLNTFWSNVKSWLSANLKTVNGESLIGSGDITISSGSSDSSDTSESGTSTVVFTCPDSLIVKQSSSTQTITAYCYLTEGDADVAVGSYSLSVSIPSSMSGISQQTEGSGNGFKILVFLVTSNATPSGYITVTCTYGDLTIVRYINVTTISSESSSSSGSTVTYSASVSSGTTLGTLTIDGTESPIVAPDAKNVLTTSSGTANASTTNSTTFLKLLEGSSAKSSIQIKGSGNTSVSGSDGVLTIGSTVDLSNYYTIDEVNALIDALREELSGSSSGTGTTVTFTVVTVIKVDSPADARTADLSGTTLTYYFGSDGCMYTRPTASSNYYAADGYYAATSYGFYVEDGATDYDYTKLTRKVYIVNSGVYSTTNVTWSVE